MTITFKRRDSDLKKIKNLRLYRMPRGGERSMLGEVSLMNMNRDCVQTFSGWECPGVSVPTVSPEEVRDPGVNVRDVTLSRGQERPHPFTAVAGVSSMSTLTLRLMRL